MKSPKPNQNKPHHTKHVAWQSKNYKNKPQKGSINHCCPSDEEKRQQQKSNQSCNQPDEQHPINGSSIIRPAHTKKGASATQTNQTKKQLAHYRVLTQHTHTQTHPTTGPAQSGSTDPTHTHTTNKIAVNADQMKGSTSARFPTAISPETSHIGLPGGALSVTLTHIKLHTPNQQHKSPGQPAFLRLIFGMVRVDQSHEIPGLNYNADRREDCSYHQRENDASVVEALSIRCPICDEEHHVAGNHA